MPTPSFAFSTGRHRATRAVMCAILVALGSAPSWAQTWSCSATIGCTTNTTSASLVVPRVAQLTLSATSLSLANNNLAAEDYATGSKTAASTLTVTAWADTGAIVTMSAATTNFTFSPTISGVTATKAASTLQASVNGGTFTGLTTAGVTILTVGGGGSDGSGGSSGTTTNPTSISFKTLLGWATDPPGTYSLTINFTITAP
jgi:hypothetical protein